MSRHAARSQRLGRPKDQRIAVVRGLVYSLVEHGRIKTTLAKAKELRRHAEKAVTVAKRNTLNARRVLLSQYPSDKTVQTLVTDLAPRFKDRNGGYTRIIKAGNRPGDNAQVAYIEWVDYEVKKLSGEGEKSAKPAKKAKAPKAAKAPKEKKAAKKAKE